MKKIFKSCTIYQKPKAFYIFPVLQTPYGGISKTPATDLRASATPLELGGAILQILDELPGESVDVDLGQSMATFRSYIKELGFKNVAAFEKKASVASVHFDAEAYKVISYEKDARNANVATGSKMLPVTATAEEIGTAVLVAVSEAA